MMANIHNSTGLKHQVSLWSGRILKLSLLVGLIVGGQTLSSYVSSALNFEITPANEPMIHRAIMISMSCYILLMALPFVPGAEIGISAMALFGRDIVPLVYLSTLVALTLAYGAGRLVPESRLRHIARALNFHRLDAMLSRLEGLKTDARLTVLTEHSPRRMAPFLLRYRYIALMLGIAMPGNIVIGGGGGIALLSGLSRLYSFPQFFTTIAVAIAPVPVGWWILGH